jgi:signal transduction histidine kinase
MGGDAFRPEWRLRGLGGVSLGLFILVSLGSVRSLVSPGKEHWAVTVLGWVLSAVICGALILSRRHPVAVAAFVLVATTAYYLTSSYDGPQLLVFVVALYWVAAEGHLRAAVGLASLAVIGTGAGTLAGNRDVNGVALIMFAGWIVAVVAVGWLRHSHQAYAREVERRAATEERLRIARELHDVIGHHLSLISVQSAAAQRRLGKDRVRGAVQAEEALAAIRASSGEALRELRATLGMLRQADEVAPTAPVAELDRIGELVEPARLAGLDVRTEFNGSAEPLPTEVDLAAYRIVQESLTNVTRHAGATSVVIRIDRVPGRVTVEITDNGRGPAAVASGTGIRGMQERARALGGDLTACAGQGGGFTVRAQLPYRNGASR